MTKPQLTRACPLCGGAMQWCGDVPIVDEDPKFSMETHTCDQITCTACKFNVTFEDLPDHHDSGDDDADFLKHLQDVADKWNGGKA